MTATTGQVYTGVTGRDEIFIVPNNVQSYVNAGNGTDYILGSDQDDYLIGGVNRDIIAGAGGNDVIIGDQTFDDPANTADDLIGGLGNDIIYAGGGTNYVNGDEGNDTVVAGQQSDYLLGGAGNDFIFGFGGNDILYGGTSALAEQQQAVLQFFGANITLEFNGIDDTATSAFQARLVGTTAITNTGDDYIDGGDGDDQIIGQDGADYLVGGAGNDSLDGGSETDIVLGGEGNDVLRGGAGNDFLDGGTGFDTVFFSDATGGVSVNLATRTSSAIAGDSGTDALNDIEAAAGSTFGDVLIGSGLANIIDGSAGNDVIYAALGADILIGGAGADRFVYAEQAESSFSVADTIVDFQTGVDTIDLSMARAGRTYSLGLNPGENGVQFLDVDFSIDGTTDMRIAVGPGSNVVSSDLVL